MRNRWFVFMVFAALVGVVWLAGPSLHSVAAQPQWALTPFPTPTPGADGIIRYKVQPGDTLWRVAAIAGITVDELRALNNLRPDEAIQPGQILILGVGVSEQPTATPLPGGVAQPTATPTPQPGLGSLCVMLYNDANGDGLYEEGSERPLAGGAVSVTNRQGNVSLTKETANDDFICFNDLPEGEYIITMAVPNGYNPTTEPNITLTLRAGDTTYVTFGAQKAEVPTPTEPEEQKSPLLGIVGGLFLVAGGGLWLYARRLTAR